MKKVIIKDYIQGLASFLDEKQIEWKQLDNQSIEVSLKDDETIFRLGFEFGKFYQLVYRELI
jgi:hypothetical protein